MCVIYYTLSKHSFLQGCVLYTSNPWFILPTPQFRVSCDTPPSRVRHTVLISRCVWTFGHAKPNGYSSESFVAVVANK